MSSETNNTEEYCQAFSDQQPELLYQLERETFLKTLAPQMMSGHLQGKLLSLLSQLLQPHYILEIGTFTGYSTLCLAKGLVPQGKLFTIEGNEEMEPIIRKYLSKARLEEQIQLLIGKAEKIIPELQVTFDLVFIDGGKLDYPAHFDLVIDKVRPGGLILADNVLWSGKVIEQPRDKDSQMLHEFNKKLREDPRVDVLILPLRDGLSISMKK